MAPARAAQLGVHPADVRLSAQQDRHGGAWIAWVPDDRRSAGEHVLSSFGASGVFEACHWLAQLRRLHAAA